MNKNNQQREDRLRFSCLDKKVATALRQIAAEAKKIGRPVYIVGGIVRDMILGRPNQDLDIVTEGHVSELAKAFARRVHGKSTVHPQFMTATVCCPSGLSVDFATSRTERYLRPGALPLVQEGTLKDDLFRRDFAINALAARVEDSRSLVLVDHYGGLADLKKKRIRVLHELSFCDDPTRIFRAIRFEQRFGFPLDRKTLLLLKAAVSQGYLRHVTMERYLNELRKIFQEPRPFLCLKRLKTLKVLGSIFPGLKFNKAVLAQIEKNISILLALSSRREKDRGAVWLMGLLAPLVGQSQEHRLSKLGLTREEKTAVLGTAQVSRARAALRKKNLKPGQIYRILSPLRPEIISFIRATSSDKIVAAYVDQYRQKICREKLFITGRDVLAVCPTMPGRQVGEILRRIHLRQLDGKLTTKRAQLNAIREGWAEKGDKHGTHGSYQ